MKIRVIKQRQIGTWLKHENQGFRQWERAVNPTNLTMAQDVDSRNVSKRLPSLCLHQRREKEIQVTLLVGGFKHDFYCP